MEEVAQAKPASDLYLTGFEKVFVQVSPTDNHEHSQASNEQTRTFNELQPIEAESFELVTMAEAARRLNMPYPTLRRHVLGGKIPSEPGEEGKPLVKLAKIEQSENSTEHAKQSSERLETLPEFSSNIQSLLDALTAEREYSKQLALKLEAASHRNGYLEAQTENYQNQIKLLTDSQPPKGWFNHFFSWFVGQKR